MSSSIRRVEALRAALAVDPEDADLRRLLADTLLELGRAEEAIPELRTILTRHPADVGLKVTLARSYASVGESRRASAILEELEREDAMTPEAWRLRTALLGFAGSVPSESGPTGNRPLPSGAPMHPADWDDEVLPAYDPSPGPPPGPEPLTDDLERPKVTFADVGGMESLKESIRLKIVYPAQHPEIYRAYGKRAGGGLLLYGPPGCGKTHIARAPAGELNATFLAVGIADVLDMWIGKSERNLHAIFESARAHRPCVLFFDEIDALAADRSGFTNTAGRSVINQFLGELDGVSADNSELLILGATNAPWHVDSAFRRPGRFDEVLFVPPPDTDARAAILTVQLRDRPVAKVDISRVARSTDAFSGADLRGLVERSLEGKLAASLKDGRVRPLETEDLLKAAKTITPTTREWFATIRNYILYANQGGLYDPVREYLDR